MTKLDAVVVKARCQHPISTGIMDKKPTYEPCGRAAHKDHAVCIEHARDVGLMPREQTERMRASVAEAKRRRAEAALTNAEVAAKIASDRARAAATIAEIRRRRDAARERRRQDERRVSRRRDKPPVPGHD